ncbi:MAG: hypothetical protein JWM68_378 [Verrucomicrobiales bacterium]|nr:hypothetical protein [Verrucomicrobiales bacterium]
MNDWNIQSRSHGCQGCEKPFSDKQHYHTLLTEDKSELRRLDICNDCWLTQYQGGNEKKGFLSYWQGVYETPPAKPPEAIQKENAETLLRKLIEQNDPAHGAACYILAVMLERKRILKVKEQIKTEGKRIFIYEQPKTGDLFTITDPNLQLNQLDAVQRDVADLLEHGLNPPAPTEAAPAPVADAAVGENSEPPSAESPSEPKSLDVA